MQKDYWKWHHVKSSLNSRTHIPFFHEREVWFCSIGVNIGFEQDGKNEHFERPILILKKFNNRFFFGIPLTTHPKEGPYYFAFQVGKKEFYLVLSQMRPFDSKRLTRKYFQIDRSQFETIRGAMKNLI